MEQTIKINVPEEKVAKYNEETQTIEFMDKAPISKSWEEFCEIHPNAINEWFVTSYGDIGISTYGDENGKNRRGQSYLESKEDAEGILALIQLTRLHDEWVGDWKPVMDETFYSIMCSQYTGKFLIDCDDHRLLIFPTTDMAIEFKDCFNDLLEKAKKFI